MLVFWGSSRTRLNVSHDIIKWVHNIGLSELNTTIHADQAESCKRLTDYLKARGEGMVKALYECERIGLRQG